LQTRTQQEGSEKKMKEMKQGTNMETFLTIINSCFTEKQIPILKQALKSGTKIYLYGRGLGKSLLAETFQNAGYAVSEPGDWTGSLGPRELREEEGLIAICVRDNPKKRISNVFDILLGCPEEIVEWVNQ